MRKCHGPQVSNSIMQITCKKLPQTSEVSPSALYCFPVSPDVPGQGAETGYGCLLWLFSGLFLTDGEEEGLCGQEGRRLVMKGYLLKSSCDIENKQTAKTHKKPLETWRRRCGDQAVSTDCKFSIWRNTFILRLSLLHCNSPLAGPISPTVAQFHCRSPALILLSSLFLASYIILSLPEEKKSGFVPAVL